MSPLLIFILAAQAFRQSRDMLDLVFACALAGYASTYAGLIFWLASRLARKLASSEHRGTAFAVLISGILLSLAFQPIYGGGGAGGGSGTNSTLIQLIRMSTWDHRGSLNFR
jgi:hypothetical protein